MLLNTYFVGRFGFFFDFIINKVSELLHSHFKPFVKLQDVVLNKDITCEKLHDEIVLLLERQKNYLVQTAARYFENFKGIDESNKELYDRLYYFWKMHNGCLYFRMGDEHDAVDAGLGKIVSIDVGDKQN